MVVQSPKIGKKLKRMKSIMRLFGKVARMLFGLSKSSEAYDSTRSYTRVTNHRLAPHQPYAPSHTTESQTPQSPPHGPKDTVPHAC